MKIVTWNCEGGFQSDAKMGRVACLEPDLAIISECERWKRRSGPYSSVWSGPQRGRGIGVFSFTHLNMEVSSTYDDSIEWIVPIRVSGSREFNLLAVWTKDNKDDPAGKYIGRLHTALDRYASFIAERETLVVGDFNSNARWDKQQKVRSHTDLVRRLYDNEIVSSYHAYYHERRGHETRPTYYHNHRRQYPSHIDYCFVPTTWPLLHVNVGHYDDWVPGASSHCPLIVEVR